MRVTGCSAILAGAKEVGYVPAEAKASVGTAPS